MPARSEDIRESARTWVGWSAFDGLGVAHRDGWRWRAFVAVVGGNRRGVSCKHCVGGHWPYPRELSNEESCCCVLRFVTIDENGTKVGVKSLKQNIPPLAEDRVVSAREELVKDI